MYFTIQATTTADSTAKQIFDFSTIEAAKANHHYFLSSSYGNTALDAFVGVILDADGNVVMRESWHKPIEPPAPEEMPDEEIGE